VRIDKPILHRKKADSGLVNGSVESSVKECRGVSEKPETCPARSL